MIIQILETKRSKPSCHFGNGAWLSAVSGNRGAKSPTTWAQQTISFRVDRSVPGRNKNLLRKPPWDDVLPAPRGTPQIEETFDTEGQTFTSYADTSQGENL